MTARGLRDGYPSDLDGSSLESLRGEFDITNQFEVYLRYSEDTKAYLDSVKPPKIHDWEIDNVVGLGMGGSAIGNEFAMELARDELARPFEAVRDYRLPSYVNNRTLAIAVSYSGNTIETLTTLKQAVKAGAHVVTVSSGGKLKEFADSKSLPHVSVPAGRQPRASTPLLAAAVAVLLKATNVAPVALPILKNGLDVFKRVTAENHPDVPTSSNLCKQLAFDLHRHLPVFVGCSPYYLPALRARGQFNENSKLRSWHGLLPEQNHNDIVGWSQSKFGSPLLPFVRKIIIGGPACSQDVRDRASFLAEIVEARSGYVRRLDATEEKLPNALAELFMIFDLASVYAAMLNQVDPASVDLINQMKQRLAGRRDSADLMSEVRQKLGQGSFLSDVQLTRHDDDNSS